MCDCHRRGSARLRLREETRERNERKRNKILCEHQASRTTCTQQSKGVVVRTVAAISRASLFIQSDALLCLSLSHLSKIKDAQ